MGSSDWIAIANAVATVGAVIAAPIVALWVGGRLQKRSDAQRAKLQLFATLVSLRHDPQHPELLRALNLIDAVFVDDLEVREAWSRYFSVLSDANLNNPVGFSVREERRRDLLLAMVNSVKWKGKITSADILRAYMPQFYGEIAVLAQAERQQKITQIRQDLAAKGLPDPFVAFGVVPNPLPAAAPQAGPVPGGNGAAPAR